MKKRGIQTIALLLALGLVGILPACGSSKKDVITIHDGQFAEMQLIHWMIKMLVEEHTDAKVEIKDQMTPSNGFQSVVANNSQLRNSYDGTLLTTFLHLDPKDVPADTTLHDYASQEASKQYQVHLMPKLGLNNTYAVAVPQEIAQQYQLNTIGDLAAVAGELVFGAEHEFFSEEGSAKFRPFTEFYGLEFKDAKQIDLQLKYSAVESGNIQVTVVYATDGLNRQAKLKILEDDQHFFPEYNGALLVRDDLFDTYAEVAPNLEEVLDMLSGQFSDDIMSEMSYQVDVEGRSAEEVAREFLQERELLPAQ